jgi:hypothetical protein
MELFVGMQRRQLSDKWGWDLLNVVVSGDLLDRLPATDRLRGDSGLELRAVGSVLAHWWEPLSGDFQESCHSLAAAQAA